MWPADKCPLTPDQLHTLHLKVLPGFRDCLQRLGMNIDLTPQLDPVYLPLAAWIHKQRNNQPLIVGINGAQGTGKSTLTALLSVILQSGFKLRVAGFSIDDLYLPRAQRQHLATTIHPLLATRGVPGTHDVELGIRTLRALCQASTDDEIAIPTFDKAVDDRKPPSLWPVWRGEVDVILFEGWCVGARPQPEQALECPINELERLEDPDGRWRRYVNEQLKGPYQSLFTMLDRLVMLKAPDMECVFRWRLQQELALAAKVTHQAEQPLRLMNETELRRFIQHYERLTRWMLEEMPERADVVLHLSQDHQFHAIEVNQD